MEKALVVGGSNGMGLAISKNLIDRGYFVIIVDKTLPDGNYLDKDKYEYINTDLCYFDDEVFSKLSKDVDLKVLMITAGIGRVTDFQFQHFSEIEKTFKIDSIAPLKIISIFYDRIFSNDAFYTGVIGSIAGWMSSPSAAVYAGAKAGLVRFIESVNIELEEYGKQNRILDISPASFKGSRFYGGNNNISLLEDLASEIVDHTLKKETLFIPQYEEIFKEVLDRYHRDPHEYGVHSFKFKHESDRLDNHKRAIIGYLSGTFDLFHVGHLNLLRRAKEQCDYLIVGVHDSGKWKGKETFIPLDERKTIIGACKYVDKVVDSCREDSDAWNLWHYDRLFVGSDYKGTERFQRYEDYFKDKGVEIVYFPYTQSTSSTQIRKTILLKTKDIEVEG